MISKCEKNCLRTGSLNLRLPPAVIGLSSAPEKMRITSRFPVRVSPYSMAMVPLG